MIIIRYKANFIMKFRKIIRIDFSIETRSLQKNQFSFGRKEILRINPENLVLLTADFLKISEKSS